MTRNEVYITNECTNNCDTCSGSLSTCTTCSYDETLQVNFYLTDSNTCVQECGSGFFEDSPNKCSPCSSDCLECTISATACLLCSPQSLTPYADP